MKTMLIQGAMVALTLLIANTGLTEVKIGETISFPGVIENIQEDCQYIVINEVRILIFPDTKIVDENGNVLKKEQLRPSLNVNIEAVRNPNGLLAKRIILKKLKK